MTPTIDQLSERQSLRLWFLDIGRYKENGVVCFPLKRGRKILAPLPPKKKYHDGRKAELLKEYVQRGYAFDSMALLAPNDIGP